MNTDTILQHLANTGFNGLGTDGSFIYMEDPLCILRSFETFLNYAWIFITVITGILLFGWAISMIRGEKNVPGNFMMNLRNLTLIFGTLSLVKPAINTIFGNDLFSKGCKTISVSVAEINQILETRNLEFSMGDDANTDANKWIGLATKLANASVAGAASQSSKSVVYTNPDGTKYAKIGGTGSWRNNNPGNITYNNFSKNTLGAIGQNGRFAIFSDEQAGFIAIKRLLQTGTYQKLTVGGAINRWAPPFENDTAAYQKRLNELTGVPLNTQLSAVNDAQLERIAGAIKTIEGWTPGQIQQIQSRPGE